eukprot:TRINITY_DN19651_c0_g1_i1.p1 TRINITY_DN19651_c0_g1~~TRINITY_DN19651_c0_g1_i1.p1  ORF type:complete len:315 (-),score=87.32 TRINITY_DN19651_c0_g1_i1:45-989(-)
MLRREGFLDRVKEAPLFNRDGGFVEEKAEGIFDIVKEWPELTGLTEELPLSVSADLVPERIVVHDAERTFLDEEDRKYLSQILATMNEALADYAQGMSYVTSFLSLTIEKDELVKMLLKFAKSDKYIPGYWKHEAVSFVRDAYVFFDIAKTVVPEASKYIESNFIFPETFAQKWFVGLCVHVLPFSALFQYFESFIREGYVFCFKFGMAVLKHFEARILALKNAGEIYALLRMDPSVVSDEDCQACLDLASEITFDVDQIPELRTKHGEIIEARFEAARQRAAEVYSDEEDFDDFTDTDDEKEEERLRELEANS